ncbi:hypothetical protein Save01_07912 [Streptomyces avermitilis]|uniref:Uncharacterized protein n=3 Tax=Streptomyces TaxID=1883 RepID=Q82R62_STRAW|nr:hypothetical protein SAVERM_282 [Streptomyces avermitilis MA-4680 = NBRC 14893]BBJ47712.1 hypothetical protein SAVMC3_03410 [Streptomyces avermitilis]GDY69907.1 hypothetical protein SAV14893_093000 [Streptomyces avermitilis]GDY80174.1 hypothetical protein SAV31267_096590 [Streptomyces avermitilis]
MDTARLRSLIDGVLLTQYRRYTEKELPALCERLGLPSPSAGDTKHKRLVASLKACPDDRLPDVAEAVLEQEELDQAERMALLASDTKIARLAAPRAPRVVRRPKKK